MSVNRDAIGDRGQSIVFNLLTRFHQRPSPLFHPQFLGDKYPAIDLFVELVGAPATVRPFFLVQAKASRRGYTVRGHRLNVQVRQSGIRNLVAYPAPTYIIGIDEPNELAFVVAAITGGVSHFTSLPTTHSLDREQTLLRLYEEVLQFWQNNPVNFGVSQFL